MRRSEFVWVIAVSAGFFLQAGGLRAAETAVLAPLESEAPTDANTGSLRQALEIQLAEIKPGMKRSQVEAHFRIRDPGPQGFTSTRYDEDPFIIEVPYDQTGGAWNPNNLVTAPPAVVHTAGQAF